MADRYVSVSATGGGNGSSSSRWTIAEAMALAAAPDRVIVGPGTYAVSFNPANGGTSDANRITWMAEDPNNMPVFDGASTASTGAAAALPLTGWALANGNGILAYASGPNSGSAAPYVYRMTFGTAQIYGVWCDDYEQDLSGFGGAGKFCSLWNMRERPMSNYETPNPDTRIHDTNGQTTGDDYFGDGGPIQHDWKGQFRHNVDGYSGFPNSSLDLRLHLADASGRNPANHKVYAATRQWGIQLSGKNYLTLQQIKFRRHKGHSLMNCTGTVLDGCDFRYMGWTGITFDTCPNSLVKSCVFLGAGCGVGHYEDGFVFYASDGSVLQDSTLAFGSHSCVYIKKSARITVRRNMIRDSDTGLTCDVGNQDGHLIESNTIHGCGFQDNMNIHCVPHSGIQIGILTNSTIRRNVIYECGYGIFITCGAAGLEVGNNHIDHNTIVDCEKDGILLREYAGGRAHDNLFRNNIIYSPTGGNAAYRRSAFNRDILSSWEGNVVQNNLFYHPSRTAVIALGDSPGSYSNVLGAGGAAPAYPAVFGTGGQQGVEADPLFVNYGARDFHLQGTSPAIGAGVAISSEIYSGTPDIGAFEYTAGGGNQAPIAAIGTISNRTPTAGTQVNFTGSGTDPDGSIAGYFWDFGDGVTSAVQNASHTYTSPGSYTVRFRVLDNLGAWSPYATDMIVVQSSSSSSKITLPAAGCSASSYQQAPSIYPPSAAVDGVKQQDGVDTGRWIANSGIDPNITLPQWWVCDIGAVWRLDQLKIQAQKCEVGRQYTYDAEIGTDLRNMLFVGRDQLTSIAGDFMTPIPFAPTDARYLRITLKANSDNNLFAGLWEVEAYGVPVAGGDTSAKIAIAGTISDSLNTPAGVWYAPAKVNDGKTARQGDPFSQWVAPLRTALGAPQNVSLVLPLGSAKTVGQLRIAPYRPQKFTWHYMVALSSDGTNYTNVFGVNQATAKSEWTVARWTPASATHIKLTFFGGTSEPAWVALYEVEPYPA